MVRPDPRTAFQRTGLLGDLGRVAAQPAGLLESAIPDGAMGLRESAGAGDREVQGAEVRRACERHKETGVTQMSITSYKIKIPGEASSAYQVVLSVHGKVVGGATLNDIAEPFPWISLLFVPKNLRRRGIGSSIVRRCVELVPKAVAIQLWVHKDNPGAISLYRHLGFVQIGAPSSGEGRFGMQLTLKSPRGK